MEQVIFANEIVIRKASRSLVCKSNGSAIRIGRALLTQW